MGLILKKRVVLFIQLFSSDALAQELDVTGYALPHDGPLKALSNLTQLLGVAQRISKNSSPFRRCKFKYLARLTYRSRKNIFNIKCMLMLVSIPVVTTLLILMYTEQSYPFNSIDRVPRFHLQNELQEAKFASDMISL